MFKHDRMQIIRRFFKVEVLHLGATELNYDKPCSIEYGLRTHDDILEYPTLM